MNTPFDTQHVKAELIEQLRQEQTQQAEKPTVDTEYQIRWLTDKINFIGSPEYYKRKAMQ